MRCTTAPWNSAPFVSQAASGGGLSCGFDLSLLQQSVYLLSVAIKDREVIQWLAKIGLGFSQQILLKHIISDTEEEPPYLGGRQGSPP